MSKPWLLYGAYGYTGRLIAEVAVDRGLSPVLAGRDPDRTRVDRRVGRLQRRAVTQCPAAPRRDAMPCSAANPATAVPVTPAE